MRDDADFAAYLAARWPFLVRSLVLIGCPRADAEDIVQSGLARCYASWEKVRESDDIDVYVYRTVLDGRGRRRDGAPVAPEVTDDDISDEVRLRREIEGELGRMAPVDREVLVLRYVADLTDVQVADVLEVPIRPVKGRFSEADFRTARETIEVPPAPYDAVVALARDRRRRRGRIAVAAVAGGVLVVAGLAWVSTRPASEPADQPHVIQAKNPVALAWYGGGRLQLKDLAVELPAVSSLVVAAGGAVYTDGEGGVGYVGPGGRVSPLGRTPVGSPVVTSDERSWAAWVTAGDGPELVVHDLAHDEDVQRIPVPPDARPVAIDQNQIFYVSHGHTFIWEPLIDRVEDTGDRLLLDTDSGAGVYALVGTGIDVVSPRGSEVALPGTAAELSPGANYVLARRPGSPGPFRPLLYDARTGARLSSGLHPGEVALDAAFGPDNTVDYLVVQAADQSIAVLRTCVVDTGVCADIVPLPRTDAEPRLAH